MRTDIIDVHSHIGVSSSLQVAGSPEDVLRKNDDNGISQSIISPIPGYEDPEGVQDSRRQNDGVAAAVAKWPDRFPRGLAVVEPRHGAAALPEVDRALGDLGLAGVMFHNDFAGLSIDSPNVFRILERVANHEGALVQMHVAAGSILEAHFQLGIVAAAFPNLTFLAAHPFMDIVASSAAIDLAKRFQNIYFDTCLTHHHLWPIEKAVDGIGADRLMFGSDNPYFHHCIDIDVVENAAVSDEVKHRIFHENAKALFGL